MANKIISRIIQINDRCWLRIQGKIRKLVRLNIAPSRWGFAVVLLAFSLFFIALAPAILTLGGENMTASSPAFILASVCVGLGVLFFVILCLFALFISQRAPDDEPTDKRVKAIAKKLGVDINGNRGKKPSQK